jgi:hypothetical protein
VKGQEGFHAAYKGRCKGCGEFYVPGDTIWSPGKGGGAFHIRCQPPLKFREATAQDVEELTSRSQARRKGIYSDPL